MGGLQATAQALGPKAVLARWQFASATLTLATNLGTEAVPLATIPPGRLVFASSDLPAGDTFPATCTAVWLESTR